MPVIDISKLKHKDDEIRTPARVVLVEKSCPKCGLGRMNFTGRAKPVTPPILEHICDKCKHKEEYRQQYPQVDFERVESGKEEV
jgi:hypothetical protein